MLPADERRAAGFAGACLLRGRRTRRGLPAQIRILGEDALFEVAQPRPGFDPQLFDEKITCVLERPQRVRLPPGAVQREHQQLAETLANRVLLREPLGLDRDRRVAAAFEVDRQLGLERDEVQLHEPLALRLRPLLVRDVGKGRAPPERERVGQVNRGVVEPTPLDCFEGGRDVALEPHRVDLFGRNVEHIAGRPGDEHCRGRAGDSLRLQDPPEIRDICLEGGGRGGRGLALPEPVDEAVDRDDPAGLE